MEPVQKAATQIHVAHVVLSLDVGGLERNVVNQVREGQELGQRVSVICLERPGVLAPRAEALGAHVVCVGKIPGLRLETIGRVKRVFSDIRPHVVHTHGIGPLFYAGPAAHAAGVPVVVHTEHGRLDYAGRFRLRLLGRVAGLSTRLFYCLTEDMASAVTAHRIVPRHKVRVILNGIDISCFCERCDSESARRSLGIPPRAPVVGTVGRLNEIKRQDVLIRAFAAVRARVPDAHLVLVGDGPMQQPLRELAGRLGLGDYVHFAGYQPVTAPYLQAMDVFALTSRSEGMPQAALEALASCVPVVATRVGGLPELIDHGRTGILVGPGDESALADSIVGLLSNRALARQLAEAGRDDVEARFDVRRMAGEYHRHFLQLLAAPL